MAKVNLVELEKKFVEYIAGFKSQYDDPKIEGYEVEEKDKGLYTTFKHGDYWYTQTLAFDDINKDTDYKNKSFGIRSDDDFWTVAYLPWEYRMLPIATLKNVLWPNQELEMTPDNPSIERKKWEAKRSAKRIVEERSWIEEKRESRRGVPFTYLAREIENVYVKKYILELLNKNDSLYKDVYNFKKKKRKGWLRRVNAYYNMARLIHIGGSCIHYKFNSKEELAEYTKQKEIINKAHEQSKFKGRHTPLTEVEKRIAKKMGRLPITVKLEYSDESNADIEEVNKYRYGEENVIFIRKGGRQMTEISKTAKDQISYLEGEGVDIRYDWVDNEIAIRPYWFILNRGSYIEIDEKELGELYSSFNSIGELAITYWAIGRLRMLPSIPILQELDWNCIVNPRNLSPNPIDKYFRNHSILSFQKGLGFITGYSKFSGWKIRNTERLDKKNYNPNHNHRLLSATMDGFLHIPVFNVEDEYMPNWAKSRAEVIVKKENGKWVFVKNSINAIIDLENLDELLLQ